VSRRVFLEFPVVRKLEDFDPRSGSLAERLLFNNRVVVLVLCALLTVALAFSATKLGVNVRFERMIPTGHPYVLNYLRHREDLSGQGNAVSIAVETTRDTVFDAKYLETLQQINDEVFLIPGVDRPYMKSLWTPSTRWIAVTEEGLDGGPVIPDGYDGSRESLQAIRINIERSGQIGQIVAKNFKSTIVYVPLLDRDPKTGEPLDYGRFANAIENIRTRYTSDDIKIHVTGFAQIIGELLRGLKSVLLFFAVAVGIVTVMLYGYTRCLRCAFVIVSCSLIAVVWLLGLLSAAGFALHPYSILVPFLIFAIGVSHGTQKMNGIAQDIGRGTHKLVAARYTFRRLFLAGLTALLAAAGGFLVLMAIPVGVIRDLALAASIGVAVLIFTNLILLPILFSLVGVDARTARRSIEAERAETGDRTHARHPLFRILVSFTQPRWARVAVSLAVLMGVAAFAVRRDLKVGDVNPGAPELRAESRYNRDASFMAENYAASSDVLLVMVETPQYQCSSYDALAETDALEWDLRQLPEVESTSSLSGLSRWYAAGLNEGSLKWFEVPRTPSVLNAIASQAPRELVNYDCNLLSLHANLKDHKADTLETVTHRVEAFSRRNNDSEVKFLLAGGTAGFEAATNEVVKRARLPMEALVYAAVIALAFATFRSFRAVLCAALPLVLTSLFCEALMVLLGIGVKVATLPVIALGVGVGVDYSLYVLTVTLARLREGLPLSEAYYRSLLFTGKVVAFAAITLATAVATWAFSPIKFQADMGILLAFMFLWNMVGALVLLPALAYFLLPHTSAHVPN
jgi:uncharacterized protein